ncbi:unnamed protein product [Prorocentrum cordatum]|uniref:Glutamine amidotransferase type-2 domain-containing protein n=1 Tax=Prorocentrum cordatum TaxID=2364126 RepID=A0ABN9RUU6_9DINO|nr:unnamed protein product [Polarella glacialis]
MCRLCAVLSDEAVLLADILLRPRMSLVRQSYAAQERRALPPGALPSMAYQQPFLNADGFGVGWYAPETLAGQESGAIRKPCVFTSLKPAWNDANLTNLSEEVRSPLILAHIRAAGPSLPVSDATCHPFRAGRLLFAHNGMVGDYEGVRRALLADLTDYAFTKAVQHGCIDSAVAFGVLLTELGVTDEEGALRERSAEELCGALGRMIKKIVAAVAGKEESLLNCVVCDDRSIVACRFATSPSAGGLHDGSEAEELQPLGASLYLSVGSRWVASPDDPMTYRMRKGADVKCCTAILSSEPLTSVREEWLPIAPNSVVVCRLSKGQSHPVDVLLYPLRQGPPPSVAALLDGSGQLEGATAAPALDSLAGAPAVPATAPALEAAPGSSAAAASRSEAWMTFTGHSEDVNCVTALCDGRVIAAGSMDGSFRLFDTASAKTLVVRRHSDSSGAVLALLALQGPSASSCLQSRESSPESSPASSPRRASPPASPGWPARRRASSFSGADLDVLLSTSQNELRVWDMTSCRTVGCSSACVGSEGEGPAELEVPCLFCFRFSPNQGQLLALAGTLDSLVLGFQSTRVFRLRLAEGWCRMMQTKRRSRTTKHVTLNVDTSQVTPSGRDCPSADGRSQKFCHHALLEPLHGGHIGFVYCVAHEPSAGVLASGGGDGRLVFWGPGGPRAVFPHGAAVLAMALSPGAEELFSGDVRGRIRIWDCSAVERGSRAVLSAGGAAAAVLSLAVAPVRGDAAAAPRCLLFAGDASGALRVWDPRRCVALREFSTSMTCCAALCTLGEPDEAPSGLLVRLACGGCSSGAVRRVDVVVPWADGDPAEDTHACSLCGDDSSFRGSAARRLLFLLLTDFVGIPTISTDPLFAPHLRRGTAWLSERFEELLGCTVRVSGHCIAARCGWDAARPLVVLYSHYDVVEPGSGWVTDPWQVSAADGYLHGRGVSDNKGPLLAQLFAVRRLLQARGAAPAAGGEDIVMRIDDKEEFSWSDSSGGAG